MDFYNLEKILEKILGPELSKRHKKVFEAQVKTFLILKTW